MYVAAHERERQQTPVQALRSQPRPAKVLAAFLVVSEPVLSIDQPDDDVDEVSRANDAT